MSRIKRFLQKLQDSIVGNEDEVRPDYREFSQNIVESFDIPELQNICFDLGIDFENLSGNNKSSVVYSLIAYCHRAGRIDELLAECMQLRPKVDWENSIKNSPQKLMTSEKPQSRRIGSERELSTIGYEMDFNQYRAFIRELFTLEEFLNFLRQDEIFNNFMFYVPLNVTHDKLSGELWLYAQRRGRIDDLLTQLKKIDPEMYERYKSDQKS